MKVRNTKNVLIALFTSALFMFEITTCYGDSWIRGVRGVSGKYQPFTLQTIAGENGHLTATATYGDYREKSESGLPSIVEGVETKDCKFWPRVTARVANDSSGPWKNIEYPEKSGAPASITLRSHKQNVMLYLDLDPFRPFIEQWKYGQLTLMNGRAAVFETRNLKPIADSTRDREWSEILMHPEPDPLIELPFAVVEVSSMGSDLQAACSYLDKEGGSPTPIEGTQTPDEKFWPYVVAQVANDYDGIWKTIGQPASVGKPITLSIKPKDVNAELFVDLEIFRPMIGRLRYGRVVLRNGKAAAFQLKNLLPPEEELPSKARTEKH